MPDLFLAGPQPAVRRQNPLSRHAAELLRSAACRPGAHLRTCDPPAALRELQDLGYVNATRIRLTARGYIARLELDSDTGRHEETTD